MEPNTPSTIPANSLPQMDSPILLIKSAWSLFKNNWKSIVPIVILPSAISYIGAIISMPESFWLKILGFIVSILGIIMSIVMVPATVNTIHRLSTEPGIILKLKDQYRLGFSYFWSVIWIIFIVILINIGSFALFVIPGIIAVVYMGFYSFALIIDSKKGFSALTESYTLVKGRWFAVLGRLLFLSLVCLIAWLIFSGILFVFGLDGAQGDVSGIIGGIISLVVNAIIAPIAIIYSYRMYTNLKSLRQADVSVKKFKNWLLAFMIVGIIFLIAVFSTVPFIAISSLKSIQINKYTTSSINL